MERKLLLENGNGHVQGTRRGCKESGPESRGQKWDMLAVLVRRVGVLDDGWRLRRHSSMVRT